MRPRQVRKTVGCLWSVCLRHYGDLLHNICSMENLLLMNYASTTGQG